MGFKQQSAIAHMVMSAALQVSLNAEMEKRTAGTMPEPVRQAMPGNDRSKLRACRRQVSHGGTLSTDVEMKGMHSPRQQRKLMKLIRRAAKEQGHAD